MRTLVVAGEYPWPENSGSRLRLATVLHGLARCGPVELFSILPVARTDIDPPDAGAGVARVGHVAFDDRPPTGPGRLSVALGGAPFEFPRPDGGASVRALTRFAHGRYDLVWYFGIRPLVLTAGLLASPDGPGAAMPVRGARTRPPARRSGVLLRGDPALAPPAAALGQPCGGHRGVQ